MSRYGIPVTPGEIRRVLSERSLRPRKRLGQNFLADGNLRDAILDASGIRPGERVLEVGPGLGILTEGLLERGARVTAVEKDSRLADFLLEAFAGEERFALVAGDVLERREIAPEVREALDRAEEPSYRVVSNLPYSVASPLLAALAREAAPPRSVVVMVQREMALRMSGLPGSRDYGPLAVLLSLRGGCRVLREFGGRVFVPPTPVRSAVVEFIPRPVRLERLLAADRLARAAFLHRRKTLVRALADAGYSREEVLDAIEALGIPADSRPEVLCPEQFEELALLLPGLGRGGKNSPTP